MKSKREINWGPVIVLASYQILLLLTLPFYLYYNTPSLSMVIVSIILFFAAGLSITGGYHRLYAHRSYRTNPIVESVILFFGAMAGQGSALRWAFDHRLHHANVDTDDDPYSIKKGFWYAHCLWIMDIPREIDPKVVSDLMRNPLVMFQHRYSRKLMLLTNVFAFLVVGFLLNDYLGACFIALFTRLFALHHFTWFINSLAHTWGDKPFSQEQSAVNNYVLSLFTFGEGYHNYHHTFANDYRNGVRWYHFDPTKWLIWTLNKFGLAYDLKRTSQHVIKKRLVMEHKNLLLEQIKSYWNNATEDLEKKVNDMAEQLVAKITDFTSLKERYRQIKMENQSSAMLASIRTEMKYLRKSLQADWKQWSELSNYILHSAPKAI